MFKRNINLTRVSSQQYTCLIKGLICKGASWAKHTTQLTQL